MKIKGRFLLVQEQNWNFTITILHNAIMTCTDNIVFINVAIRNFYVSHKGKFKCNQI